MRKIRWRCKALFSIFTLFIFVLFTFTLFNDKFIGPKGRIGSNDWRKLEKKRRSDNDSESNPSKLSLSSKDTTLYGHDLWLDKNGWQEEQLLPIKIDPSHLLNLLPHLKRKSYRHLTSLNARVLLKATNLLRSPPELILLIPSMHRKEHNYLVDTLKNLLQNMAEEERHRVLVLILLTENPWDNEAEAKLQEGVKHILASFAAQVDQGLVEVVSPPREWFPPDLEGIVPTLGDSPERMRWRTKQNLDYAFAMLHVHMEKPNARFYVQLEDDIISLPNFASELLRFASAHPNFFLMEFSSLGFIGRMFHNNDDLFHMANFILLLHRATPVDWILSEVLSAKFCSLDEAWKVCLKKRILDVVVFQRNPPLFQHVGLHSSLPGKRQNLTEKSFGKNQKIKLGKSGNPPASHFKGPNGGAEEEQRLQALYERFVPYHLDGQWEERDGTQFQWEIGFGPNSTVHLKALRIFFSAQLQFRLALVQELLPPSLLQVRIGHLFDNFTFPEEDSPLQRPFLDHLLVLPRVPLENVSSIQIGLAKGQWRTKAMSNFTLAAIHLLF